MPRCCWVAARKVHILSVSNEDEGLHLFHSTDETPSHLYSVHTIHPLWTQKSSSLFHRLRKKSMWSAVWRKRRQHLKTPDASLRWKNWTFPLQQQCSERSLQYLFHTKCAAIHWTAILCTCMLVQTWSALFVLASLCAVMQMSSWLGFVCSDRV